jgi:hypothetical protein
VLLETAFYRYKALIEQSPRAGTLPAQKVEARIACAGIDCMASLGHTASPSIYRLKPAQEAQSDSLLIYIAKFGGGLCLQSQFSP